MLYSFPHKDDDADDDDYDMNEHVVVIVAVLIFCSPRIPFVMFWFCGRSYVLLLRGVVFEMQISANTTEMTTLRLSMVTHSLPGMGSSFRYFCCHITDSP